LKLVARDADDLIVRPLNQLPHSRNSILIARVNSKQHALDSLTFIGLWLLRFFSAVGCQAQELRQNEKLGIQRALEVGFNFAERLLFSFLKCLGPFCFFGCRSCLVLLVDFLVLDKLLLVLS
jgi:hypothetical protein